MDVVCGISRRYIDVCYCDMFSVVNVYLDHLKFCVVCINSRRGVCSSPVSLQLLRGRILACMRCLCVFVGFWDRDYVSQLPMQCCMSV